MPVENITIYIYANDSEASIAVAARIAEVIRKKASEGKPAVLGLTAGHTPIQTYRELIRMHHEEHLDFSSVITFNLDEYWPIEPEALQSCRRWMYENFFDHINIDPKNINIPSGKWPEDKIIDLCHEYEHQIQASGGIDIQILDIGASGHIGFNEPGAHSTSRTRRVRLDNITRMDAASDFFGEDNVPETVVTMGIGTLLEAHEICVLAFGENNAPIIRRVVEGEVSTVTAAGFLRNHPNAACYLDNAAAAELTRITRPWLLGPCDWSEKLQRHAVLWLSEKLGKPILKLTEKDYFENDLTELIKTCGGSYQLNIKVFRYLMDTITGWPGGKGKPKRILIFSPHPDDDVISMGGTMIRLVEQEHETHTAYMVSGNLSVFDHLVARYADFVREFNSIFGLTLGQSIAIEQHIDRFLKNKLPGDVDSQEVQAIKTLIRKTEAVDAAKFCGLSEEHIHFLNLPFYNTGRVQKFTIGDDDIEAILALLNTVQPEMVFAAGDISDPHGTHRLCLEAVMKALQTYRTNGDPEPEVWLYRGAWQEWAPEDIDMAVPLSPDELRRKRFAIFRHESQKDRAMFPGPYDSREFWQRAEDRNIATAATYDRLGLPEYHAIEAFVRRDDTKGNG